MLSAKFTKLLKQGRAPRGPDTREELLVTLLRKRAAAHQSGAEDLEALLRDQIRWALPMEKGEDGEQP